MDMSTEQELFREIKEINVKVGKIETAVEVLKQREQPSVNCREKMDKTNDDINKVGSKVDKKVGWYVLLTLCSFLFVYASGSYIYTWLESKDINKKIEDRK